MKEKIKGEDVVVLIDCGATQNFISDKLVSTLSLPMKETSNYGVILESRIIVKGKGVCGKIEVMVGEWKITNNFLPLKLGRVYVILGMQ